MAKLTIVFVHGLWMHKTSWAKWEEFFRSYGYETVSLEWPGDPSSISEARENPSSVANRGIEEITRHLARQLVALPTETIAIGHSFGGLLVQKLLGLKLIEAAIVIDSAPPRGVWLR